MPLQAQSLKYTTRPIVQEIKTLQTIVDGDFMKLPVIDISGNQTLEISFDYLAEEQPWLSYSLVHCNAEWNRDYLDEMDYADGFLPVRIEDVEPSFNTFIPYYHYSLKFPNENVALRASGNYAVLIHPEDNEGDILAIAAFSVSEQLAFVKGEVFGNTDIDFRQSHQQLSLDFTWGQSRLPYLDPVGDVKLMVSQNRREETKRQIKVPTRLESGHVIYEHNKDLIFEAGNNYRRFEFTDVRYATLGVDQVRHIAPYYYAMLKRDVPRHDAGYLFDRDQDGRYLVHALHVDDEIVEAEYFKARFFLKAPFSFDQKGVYLDGDFTYGQRSEDFRMNYDEAENIFWKDVILKQGAYNYQYVVDGSNSIVEGNYYETDNEYDVYIYYHPNGARYDRLLGVAQIYAGQ